MHKHRHIIVSISGVAVLLVSLVIMLEVKTPDELGPAGVALFFLLVYGLIAWLIGLVLIIISYIRGKKLDSYSHLVVLCMAAALPPVMLLALNTIRGISFIDIVFALTFGVVLLFYLRRR